MEFDLVPRQARSFGGTVFRAVKRKERSRQLMYKTSRSLDIVAGRRRRRLGGGVRALAASQVDHADEAAAMDKERNHDLDVFLINNHHNGNNITTSDCSAALPLVYSSFATMPFPAHSLPHRSIHYPLILQQLNNAL